MFADSAVPVPSEMLNPLDDDRPILVATNGHPRADTAMVAAAFLARRTGQRVHAFSVVEQATSGCHESRQLTDIAHPEVQPAQRPRHAPPLDDLTTRQAEVETQIGLTVGETAHWPVSVRAGLLREASHAIMTQTRAQLLVIGQCHQRRLGAPAGACGATEHLTCAAIPVYIAAPTLRGIARRVVVAMDLTEASERAARLAIRLSAADASIYLVHVLPPGTTDALDERRSRLRRVQRDLMRDLAATARGSNDTRIESILLSGPAAPETLGFAEGIQADLIACGASSLPVYPTAHPCPPSLGRVTRELIRRVSCSLLVVPDFMTSPE